MAKTDRTLVICLDNTGFEVSLERRKIYVTVPDPAAVDHDCIRVIDESGEDYVYPARLFVKLELPATVQQVLLQVADSAR